MTQSLRKHIAKTSNSKANNGVDNEWFTRLPKYEQNFRWSLFLQSNGYSKQLSKDKIEELRQKYVVKQTKLVID
jgi:hypothetical protein